VSRGAIRFAARVTTNFLRRAGAWYVDEVSVILSRLAVASAVVSFAALGAAGCSEPLQQNQAHIVTRREIPIPVCTTPIAPAKRSASGKSVVRDLDPEQWMGVIIPNFAPEHGLGPTDVDCTGHYVFANESLRGGVSQRGWPRRVDPDDVDMKAGPNGLRVVWVRALKFENGDEGGPIALVRAIDDRAEVFAVGSYRGPVKSQLTPVRLGDESLVVSESLLCPDQDDCRKRADYYLARRGRLILSATVDLERTKVVPSVLERGLYAKYMLKTDVTYKSNGIQLLEQMKVKIIHYEAGDRDSDRDLRKVEFQRFLKVDRDTLFSSNDPLWERVVGQD
jgi:hypothetical protein